jgi:hypothetical protein
VHPDNALVTDLFLDMDTQWRIGFSGVTGFDYAVLPALMDFHGILTEERKDVFRCLRIMEIAAIRTMREDK